MNTRKAIILVMVMGLVGVLATGCSKKAATATTTYQEVTVGTGNVAVSITTTGNVDYANYENLSFGASGTVGTVNVKVGDLVKNGQVLASLDPDAWNQQLQTLNNTLQTAQQNLITAQSNVAKAQGQVVTQQLAVTQAQLTVQTAQNTLDNISAVATAQNAVDTAQANIDAAQASLDAASAQGDATTALNMNNYITKSLKPALLLAQQNLQQVMNGTSTTLTTTAALAIANAELQVSQAQNTLIVAQAAIADDNNAVTFAQQAVATAQQAVTNAQTNLNEANAASIQIVAPFDGAVTAVNVSAGVGLSGQYSGVIQKGATAIVLADTSKFVANMLVNEMQIPSVSIGMSATVQPLADTSVTLPARVTAIAPVSTNQSGVVNYAVTATILSVPSSSSGTTTTATNSAQATAAQKALADALAAAVSSGQITQAQADQLQTRLSSFVSNLTTDQINQLVTAAAQRGTSTSTTGQAGNATTSGGNAFAAAGSLFSGRSTSAAAASFQLRQGMSLTVNLIEQQAQNVLVVPNQAVKTQGSTSTVLVMNSSGVPEQRQVTIGLRDTQNTQIVSGLNAGDIVLIAKTSSTTTTTTSRTTTTGGFGIPGLGGLGR